MASLRLECWPCWRWPSICLSITRTNCVSLVLLPARDNVKPGKQHFGSRYRARVWLCGIHSYGRRSSAVWRTPSYLLAADFAGGPFAFGYGCIHGSSRNQPSSCRRCHLDRFPRNYFEPRELIIIEVAVFLLVTQALAINRLAGLPYPLWNTSASTKGVNGGSE